MFGAYALKKTTTSARGQWVKLTKYTPTASSLLHWHRGNHRIPQCPWWRYQMETFSVLLAICAGNSPVTPVNSPHKGQWRRALMFSLICTWTNGWVNNGEAVDFRRHRTHYDVTVMQWTKSGAHFTKNFPSLFKFDGNLVLVEIHGGKSYFAHATTAKLPWHVIPLE